jgi:hypothetical protein
MRRSPRFDLTDTLRSTLSASCIDTIESMSCRFVFASTRQLRSINYSADRLTPTGSTTMTIEFDRRHAFYLDPESTPHVFCPYRLDRLWRGEPDTMEPQLTNQRIRFALLHIERFTSPPRVVLEHYPIIPFDAHGRIDLDAVQQQLQAAVDLLESTDYAPTETASAAAEWHPDPFTRRYLIAATRAPSWCPRPTLRAHPHRTAA